MADPFLGEIKMVGFNFAPRGWAACDGQLLPINQNQSLYSLIGNTYGGDGRTSFALPDLRGRTPIHKDNRHALGQQGGEESVALTTSEMPSHRHQARAQNLETDGSRPQWNMLAQVSNPVNIYRQYDPASAGAMRSGSLTDTGGGQPHNNVQPLLVLNFTIALQGVFPSRS
jgi:microcystin-dependent protein